MSGAHFFKSLASQLRSVWQGMNAFQRLMVSLGAVASLALLLLVFSHSISTVYTPLYTEGRLTAADAADIRNYLDEIGISYKLEGEEKILVPEPQVHRLRLDLASVGLPKMRGGDKGFELFDTNTWIKGEKELQIMEMRALKGQLERDIAEYDNIRSAKVILDIAPPRPFGGSLYKTKASVILTLLQGAILSQSQLRAITFHVAGAVRGLTPNMIAISDTSGRLYQAIDPEGNADMLRSEEITLEERIKAKIDGMLAMVIGYSNFYSTVQVSLRSDSEASNKIENISIGVVIDKAIALNPDKEGKEGRRNIEALRTEIQNQLMKILEGYNVKVVPAVDFVEFDRRVKADHNKESNSEHFEVFSTLFFCLTVGVLIAAIIWLLRRNQQASLTHPFRQSSRESSSSHFEWMIAMLQQRIRDNAEEVANEMRRWIQHIDYYRASLILVTVGTDYAGALVPFFSSDEMRGIGQWVEEMNDVPEEAAKKAVHDFCSYLIGGITPTLENMLEAKIKGGHPCNL